MIAYRRQNFESFQDAMIRTFEYFGGVSRRVIFDNARIAVKEGFVLHDKATDKYIALILIKGAAREQSIYDA